MMLEFCGCLKHRASICIKWQWGICLQVICEVGKAVGAEGLVAGQIVDIKSEGMAEQVCIVPVKRGPALLSTLADC